MQDTTRHSFPCRSCGASVSVGPEHRSYQFWIGRCPNCGLQVEKRLPTIQKKIIYLDQFVLSNILARKEERWKQVYELLNLLSYFEVVVCPYSDIHRDESLVAEYSRDDLKELYRELSHGISFKPLDWVEHVQLLRSLRRYLDAPVAGDGMGYSEYCEKDPNCWSPDMRVHADFPLNQQFVDRLNNYKASLQIELETEAEEWRSEENPSFSNDVQREATAYGQLLLSVFREFDGDRNELESQMPEELAAIYRHFTGGDAFNPDIPPSNKPYARLVHGLGCEVLKIRPDESDPISVVEQFLASNEATNNTPFLAIMSRLRARIAEQARNPRGPRKPKASDVNDIDLISHFAPYCDAMVIDNHFRSVATQVGVERDHDVKLFSSKTLPDFLQYLTNCLLNIPQSQRLAIKQVIPNVSMLPFLATEAPACNTNGPKHESDISPTNQG